MNNYSFKIPYDEYIPDGEDMNGYWNPEDEKAFWEEMYVEDLEEFLEESGQYWNTDQK